MTEGNSAPVSVRIVPNTSGNPAGKLADAEVVFGADFGPLRGLKLIGFAIWERRSGGRNVTFPARQYSVNGERRSFALLRPILEGKADMVMGSRILNGGALKGGMPFWKFVANRVLTIAENIIYRTRLTDCHSGFRAYSRKFLTTVPFLLNSDDFVFDSQMIAQAVYMEFNIAEIPVQARYFPEASSVNFKVSTIYGIKTAGVMLRFLLQKLGLLHSRFFDRKLTDVVSKYHHESIFRHG